MTRSTRSVEVLLLTNLMLVGCTGRVIVDDGVSDDGDPPVDDGPPADDDEPPSDDDEPPPSDDDDDPPSGCVDIPLAFEEFPFSIAGTLEQGVDRFSGSCAGTVSSEVTFSFSAPRDGTYLFDTRGTDLDTVLYLLGPDCEPPELACNDDAGGTLESEVGLGMTAGQTITIVLDSFGGEGPWSLQIREAQACPDASLEDAPEVYVEGQLLSTGTDSVVSGCGGSGADISYAWVPPFSGVFRFTTEGSNFDTVLSVHSESCAQELSCNDDALGDVNSALDLELEEGVPVVVAVGSYEGTGGFYQLAIFPL